MSFKLQAVCLAFSTCGDPRKSAYQADRLSRQKPVEDTPDFLWEEGELFYRETTGEEFSYRSTPFPETLPEYHSEDYQEQPVFLFLVPEAIKPDPEYSPRQALQLFIGLLDDWRFATLVFFFTYLTLLSWLLLLSRLTPTGGLLLLLVCAVKALWAALIYTVVLREVFPAQPAHTVSGGRNAHKQ